MYNREGWGDYSTASGGLMKYDYKCEKCGKTVEIEKGMNDPSPTKCPLCGEEGLKRIYELSGVVYKVGGFYCHP